MLSVLQRTLAPQTRPYGNKTSLLASCEQNCLSDLFSVHGMIIFHTRSEKNSLARLFKFSNTKPSSRFISFHLINLIYFHLILISFPFLSFPFLSFPFLSSSISNHLDPLHTQKAFASVQDICTAGRVPR